MTLIKPPSTVPLKGPDPNAPKPNVLGQEDFFRLLTTQMQMQDPFEPVDNKEMLAQMAQFSSLATNSDMSVTLTSIASKLDALIELQLANADKAEKPAEATT